MKALAYKMHRSGCERGDISPIGQDGCRPQSPSNSFRQQSPSEEVIEFRHWLRCHRLVCMAQIWQLTPHTKRSAQLVAGVASKNKFS